MRKNRIKNLRTITVDEEEYKWMMDGRHLKIWKDKKVIYDDWDYFMVGKFYNLEKGSDSMTPKIVAKVIRIATGTGILISNKEFLEKFNIENGFGLDYFDRHVSFEDRKTEKMWSKFYDYYTSLKNHLNVSKPKIKTEKTLHS